MRDDPFQVFCPCRHCCPAPDGGDGTVYDQASGRRVPCPRCDGGGTVLTDFGDAVLAVIEWRERKKAAEAKAAVRPVICWKCRQPITAGHPDDGIEYASMPPQYAHATCPPKPAG